MQIATFLFITMVISFQRQLQEDDNNAITAEYDLYSDGDEYDSIERQGKADDGSFKISIIIHFISSNIYKFSCLDLLHFNLFYFR